MVVAVVFSACFRRRLSASHPPGAEQDHQRPPQADQELVAPGHVGQSQWAVLGGLPGLGELLARLHGEHEVDRVFGEDRDQGQERQGESGRDVELDDLGRPGEDEGGADDCHPIEQSRRPPDRGGCR